MKTILCALSTLILFTCCCPGAKVSVDKNRKRFAGDDKTYTWKSFKTIKGTETQPIYYNELNDARIKQAVNTQMQLNHYQLIDSGGALLVQYHFEFKSIVSVQDSFADPAYYQSQVLPYYKNYDGSQKYDFDFAESPLIIEMVDAKTQALVWIGSAANSINATLNERPDIIIQHAVNEMFKNFTAIK